MCPRILIIDEDPRVLALLGMILKNEGADVVVQQDAMRGLDLLKLDSFDVLFTEMRLHGHGDLEVLRKAREIQPTLPVVVITGCGSVESTVSAFRLGAVDYLTKPLRAEQVTAGLARALAKSRKPHLGSTRAKSHIHGVARKGAATVVAASSAMKQVVEMCRRISVSTLPILVAGELGVGKERIVRLIHSLSEQRDKPWVKVNCDAVQESRLVEMFFGQQGEADRADESTRCGLIEQAAGGMLFLQNLTGLPRWMQKELLQAAQMGVFVRKGSSEPIAFRARIAASTLHAPAECVKKGILLNELHHFFGATPINVPALRNRREDIRPLVDALMCEVDGELVSGINMQTRSFTNEAMQLLEAYDWPGNIHELGNFIRRVIVFVAESEITATHVTELLPSSPAIRGTETITVPFVGDLKLIERAIVAEVIHRAHGNKSAAARSLGLHRKTLYRIIESDVGERSRANGRSG